MKQADVIQLRLEPAIKECRLHEHRLDYALARLSGTFPLASDTWESLDEETISAIDQLLFRYNKLQDAMGQRLFSAILALGGE